MAEVMRNPRLNRTIARMKGVRAAVYEQAEAIHTLAAARLAPHRQQYQARLELNQGRVDTIVSLVDPAALSIEFGHYAGPRGLGADRTYVEGLNLFKGFRFKDGVA